ncbi:MAG TPA: hypothetical protein ENG42_03080, partial [Candidatus Aenigmarchaeota archaeon]|nr:hypothetical protein [Candidatus Aenigmarchaeota archaeon]
MHIDKRNALLFSVTALGISSMVTQLAILREFLNIFNGNELVVGIILMDWLLINGIGSYFAKYIPNLFKRNKLFIALQLIIAVLPFISFYLTRTIKTNALVYGVMAGFTEVITYPFLILFPYCFISGMLLTFAASLYSEKRRGEDIGKIYFIDNIGDILGGFIFSFILIFLFNSFQMAYIVMFINLLASCLLSYAVNKKYPASLFLLSILLLSIPLLLDIHSLTLKQMYKGQEILLNKNTPYGFLVITKTSNQINFFENGVPLFSTNNTIMSEKVVHYAMSQRTHAKDVLLISGGISGSLGELMKYNASVDYVELDPEIIRAGIIFTQYPKGKIRTIIMDGRLWIKTADKKYDVIIVDLPDPLTAQINRFYTIQFFQEAKKRLKKDGVIEINLAGSENYIGNVTRDMVSVIYTTISHVFNHSLLIPGDTMFIIASDGNLTYNISGELMMAGIDTEYVNKYYLSSELSKTRIEYINNVIRKMPIINEDFRPIAYYYGIKYWLAHFHTSIVAIVAIIALVVLFFGILTRHTIPAAIFTTGFAASFLEIIILIAFQSIYGYVYQQIGVIVTMFMLG